MSDAPTPFLIQEHGLQVTPLETASLYALCFLFFLVNGGGAFSGDRLFRKWLVTG
ncbi:MAG: hypothetical protein HC865_06160 [Cyanobacteria bacterium RU_5_0]|nr:hypothetical protein [Cyanobacteria bacterium RU_5_0]